MKNRKICIVGYGKHVKSTIIPSLNTNPQLIKIVTQKKIDFYETFSNIKSALKKLSKDYIFFNSTPPKFHYLTSKLILNSGFNLIVEKPLCINVNQLNQLYRIAKKKNLFIFENMMYFYSKQFTLLKKILKKKDIKKIDINFSIPRVKKKSFRSENNFESSILYDLGCYPFSLISYFKFNNDNFKVFFKKKSDKLSLVKIFFLAKNIEFNITIAVYKVYKNYLQITYKNKSIYRFNYFFYGKKIQKINYFQSFNKKIKFFKINEDNLFKNILNYSNEKLMRLHNFQYLIIKRYLISLNQIKKKLNYSPY
jgi:hypothetical protein